MAKAKKKFLGEHRKFLGDTNVVTITSLDKGQTVRFNYAGKERTVFVVAGNWEGKLHAVDLNGISRHDFLTIVNAPPKLTPMELYEKVIKKPRIRDLNAYRTYDRDKVANLRMIGYDSTLRPDERGEPGIRPKFPRDAKGRFAPGNHPPQPSRDARGRFV